MSESTTARARDVSPATRTQHSGGPGRRAGGLLTSALGRNLGLIVALAILCIVGVATAGDRFADIDNVLTILRLASVIGVISVGMTFVIIGGGIDLSVGAITALASVWATTLATQALAQDVHWIVMVGTALLVGAGAGLVNGVVIAYGRLVAFIATLAMLAAARGLAEIMSNRRTQIVQDRDFLDFFSGDVLGIPTLVIIFALAAAAGWVLLNRTTFGRRTFAVGGNAEAARLAGIRVQRHTVKLYVLSGITCGIAAVMLMARTTTGSSTHGSLYELDAIAAVVIGGTLLIGGRGTIVGTVLGVLIFTTLGNVFTLNNLSSSAQAVARGVIIVAAVLLQMRLADRENRPRGPRWLPGTGGISAPGPAPAGAGPGDPTTRSVRGDRPAARGSAPPGGLPPGGRTTGTTPRPPGGWSQEGDTEETTCLQRGSARTAA
jgi:ribose transport system permease protein